MQTVFEARSILSREISAVETGKVPLDQAVGRVLRQDVFADRPLPPCDRSLRDGIAIRLAGGEKRYEIKGELSAGKPACALPEGPACIEIMTGAPIPAGADTVVQKEDYTVADGWVTLDDSTTRKTGDWIHREGSDRMPGDLLIGSGTVLGARHLGVCASVGLASVAVSRPLNVTVLTTGDEMVPIDAKPEPWEMRRSNGAALNGLLARIGGVEVTEAHLQDDRESIRSALEAALGSSDIVVFTGGVSKGRYDFVGEIIPQSGAQVLIHGVRQRPGKPLLVAGHEASRSMVFGLPGNPLSVLVCAQLYLVPAIRQLLGAPSAEFGLVELGEAVEFPQKLAYHLPARIEHKGTTTVAMPVHPQNSGDFTAAVETDGFVVLDGTSNGHFPAGAPAMWVPWT